MKRCLQSIFLLMVFELTPISVNAQSNMIGVITGAFFTSNPELTWYNHNKTYFDAGLGGVYEYKNDVSDLYGYEIISSLMISTCSTARQYNGKSKTKILLPVEGRFNYGLDNFKIFLGVGIQYNFIWTSNSDDSAESRFETSAHQFSANGSIGFNILGRDYPVHFLVGAKFHFPIVNNGEGVYYSEGERIDVTKDKTCVSATGAVAGDLGRRFVLMLNYDYPLGSNRQTEMNGTFFEMRSQSITLSAMWKF